MGRMLLPLVVVMLASPIGGAAAPSWEPDAQGWNGFGWYLTSGSVYGPSSEEDRLTYVLFGGPYPFQNGCLEAYDRLTSPAGVCRFLNVKPPAFTG
jgi:hypothetical protein